MPNDRIRDTEAAKARRENPTLNQSGDAHDPASPPVRAERMAGEPRAGDAEFEKARADEINRLAAGGPVVHNSATNGLGVNGEFRIGKITLALGGDKGLRLRHERVGTETTIAEAVLEGLLEEHYFTRHIGEDGTTNSDLTGRA